MERRSKFPDVERPKILQASQTSLWKPLGRESLEYLNKRGITDEVLKCFNVGFCPREVEHELAGKIIMPLFDPSGSDIIAFTTRDPKAEKRYQHWHEVFEKSRYLYGVHVAKEAIRKQDKVIVVEGQFDTMCLHSYGFHMTVGLCGHALSIMHVTLLARYCSEIYLMLDSDAAGDGAIEAAMELYKRYQLAGCGMLFIPVCLPEGVDPDDFVMKFGSEALVELLRKSKQRVLNV